jgi:hypothetical protein
VRKIFWFFGALILVVGVLLAAGYGYLLKGVYATTSKGEPPPTSTTVCTLIKTAYWPPRRARGRKN